MLNNIVIMGRLVKDPEETTVNGVDLAKFTVAVERDYKKETDFFDCTAWRNTAKFVGKYFRKGSMVVVRGRMQSSKWKDRDNKVRVGWDLNADDVYFGGSKGKTEEPVFTDEPGDYEGLPF